MPALQLLNMTFLLSSGAYSVIYSWHARTLTHQEILTSLGR